MEIFYRRFWDLVSGSRNSYAWLIRAILILCPWSCEKFKKQIKHFFKEFNYFLKLCARKIKLTNNEQIIRLNAEASVKKTIENAMEVSQAAQMLWNRSTILQLTQLRAVKWHLPLASPVCWVSIDVSTPPFGASSILFPLYLLQRNTFYYDQHLYSSCILPKLKHA